ncbi:MAG: hypothetical protein ACKO96_23630 [Flammeovirgaceae bacterium]
MNITSSKLDKQIKSNQTSTNSHSQPQKPDFDVKDEFQEETALAFGDILMTFGLKDRSY